MFLYLPLPDPDSLHRMSSGLFSPLVALRRTRELSLLRGSVYFCLETDLHASYLPYLIYLYRNQDFGEKRYFPRKTKTFPCLFGIHRKIGRGPACRLGPLADSTNKKYPAVVWQLIANQYNLLAHSVCAFSRCGLLAPPTPES